MNFRQGQIGQLNLPQDENYQESSRSGVQIVENKKDQFTCEDVQRDLKGLKELAGLIKNAISSDKLDDIDEIIRKITIKEPEPQFTQPLTMNQTAQNQQPVKPTTTQRNFLASKSIVQANKDSNRNSNAKNQLQNTNKVEQDDNKRYLQMDEFLDQMRAKVDNGMRQTIDLTQLLQGKKKPDNQTIQKSENINEKDDWDVNNFEFQKKLDRNRDEISHAQKKIHDMQNKRLVQKVEELYRDLQDKIQDIESKEKDYIHLSTKIQNYFGILYLSFDYEDENERVEKKDKNHNQNNVFRQSNFKNGYFIFDLKKLIVAESLHLKDEPNQKEYHFPYDKLTKVQYKLNKDRLMELTWNFGESQEQLNIRFSRDEDMNKFDMLLYILSLNYSRFSSNTFSGYFDEEKNKWIISPFESSSSSSNLRQMDNVSQSISVLANSANFGHAGNKSNLASQNFRQDVQKVVSHSEKMQMAQLMDKQIQYSQLNNLNNSQNNHYSNEMNNNNNHDINLANSYYQNKTISPINNSILYDQDHTNQSMVRQTKKNRSFTPNHDISMHSEYNQMNQSQRKKETVFISYNGQELTYKSMNNEKFWEQQIITFVNQKSRFIRIVLRDKFRQQFKIRVESNIKNNQNGPQEFDIPHFSIKKSDKKERVIEIESRSEEKIEIEIQDGKLDTKETKFDYFLRLFKFFCSLNLQKQKEISKAISDLENGMIFLKYSRGSRYPHEKIFHYRYEKEKERHLLISKLPSDTNGRKEKVTNFLDINTFNKEWQNGPGFKKFQKDDPRIINELCIVIMLNNSKTIEILAKTQQQRDQFYSYLELITEQLKANKT